MANVIKLIHDDEHEDHAVYLNDILITCDDYTNFEASVWTAKALDPDVVVEMYQFSYPEDFNGWTRDWSPDWDDYLTPAEWHGGNSISG